MAKIILINRLLIAVNACPFCKGDLFLEYKEKWYKCFSCSRYFFRFLGREVEEAKRIFASRRKDLECVIAPNIKKSTAKSIKEH